MKKAEFGAILSIVAYVLLAAIKIAFGLLGDSQALFADGLNSFSDILVSIVILIGLIFAKKPVDKNHPYGHQRVEEITTIIASFLMMVVGFQVITGGIGKIFAGELVKPKLYTAYIAFGTGAVILLVGLYNNHLAKKLNSNTLKAVAKDNLSDALVSLGAGIAIFAAYYKLAWIDPAVSIIIGLIIIKTAFGIFIESSNHLIDVFDYKKAGIYEKTILEISDVKKVIAIRGRSYGHTEHLDIVIAVDPNISVSDSHKICDKVEELLISNHSIIDAIVHVEPFLEE